MTTHASGGTCLSVSAAAPATNDAAGYVALTWTLAGELSTIGDIVIDHKSGTFYNMCTNKESVTKGAENVIMVDVTVGNDRDDAGQVLLTAARASINGKISCKVVESNGDIQYFQARVMSEGTKFGSSETAVMTPYKLGLIAPATGNTIIVVNTP